MDVAKPKWFHPELLKIRNEIVGYMVGNLKLNKLPSTGIIAEKIGSCITHGTIMPIKKIVIREEDGTENNPFDNWDYARMLSSEIHSLIFAYNFDLIRKWRMDVEHSDADLQRSFISLIEYLLVRTFHISQLFRFAGKHVVVPSIDDGHTCERCKKDLEGKVYYVSPAIITEPTHQECNQYLWINKDIQEAPLGESYYPCVPYHKECRHMIVPYRGGDPYAYRVKV